MTNLVGQSQDQTPSNQLLGGLAFMNPEGVVLRPAASVTPKEPGDVVFQLTSNTAIAIRVMGSDGVVRTATLTLS